MSLSFYVEFCVGENGSKPQKGTKFSAGYDIASAIDFTLQPNSVAKISTDLRVVMHPQLCCKLMTRSSLALKDIIVLGGLIDSDYRGEIFVILKNDSKQPFLINKRQKIAQMVFEIVPNLNIHYVDKIEIDTERGIGGFGSTDS